MPENTPDRKPTLVINAGGQSRRMGRAKALLPVPPDETPLLVHMVRRLQHLVEPPTIIVANDADLIAQLQIEPQPRFVPDHYPETGTLGGIATGLHALPQDGWALIMACDLPLVSARLCQALIAFTAERDAEGQELWDVVMPVVEDFAEPLHALYHARTLPAIEARLSRSERRAISFHPDVRVRTVDEATLRRYDPALHSFINANTPDEWAAALALLALERET
jgi:molybdopterin-guanine dinucleotide biosynthesis protein A